MTDRFALEMSACRCRLNGRVCSCLFPLECQGENFTFALEILDQLIDALSDENESES